MAHPSNTTSAWSIRYLHILLLYFICPYPLYFSEARPTGLKLPCEDGCSHIHLVLGADNHLAPRWTFHQVCDAPEIDFPVEVGNHLVPSADFEHRTLGSNLQKHPILRSEVRDKTTLILDVNNRLVPICSTIGYGGEAGNVLSPGVGNQMVSFRKDICDGARGAPLLSTVLDIGSHLVGQRTVFRRDRAGDKDKHQVFMLDTDSHIIPLWRVIHPEDEFYPQTTVSNLRNHMVVPGSVIHRTEDDKFLTLNSFSHLVPMRQSGHCCDEANEVHFLSTGGSLVSRRQVIRRDETDKALFLDMNSHSMPLRNVVQGEVDLFHPGNQPVPQRRMARRAESDDDASTSVVEQVESGIQQGNHKTTSIEELCLQLLRVNSLIK